MMYPRQVIYGQYGKHPKEALFYTHALPLPGFLLLAPDILHHWSLLLSSQPVTVPLLHIQLPVMLLYLLVLPVGVRPWDAPHRKQELIEGFTE